MRNGMTKGLVTGLLIGGSAATIFGVMNWQTEKKWNVKARKTGNWVTRKANNIVSKF